jgi:2,4'-dihydroxyacetophenone dioxygenase
MRFATRQGTIEVEFGSVASSFDIGDIDAIPPERWLPLLAVEGGGDATMIWQSDDGREGIGLTRMRPGMVSPTHIHTGTVFGYILQGTWRYREYDWVATAGSIIHEAPDSIHTFEVIGDEEVVGIWYQSAPNLYLAADGMAFQPEQQGALEAYLQRRRAHQRAEA